MGLVESFGNMVHAKLDGLKMVSYMVMLRIIKQMEQSKMVTFTIMKVQKLILLLQEECRLLINSMMLTT